MKIRHPNNKEYEDIEKIANEGYLSNFYESKESFISKIEGFPEGSYVADLDGVVGYIVSFPYELGKTFPINTNYEIIENPNCWYIHDLSVLKEFRNKGIAKLLAKKVIEKSWNVIALTAVQNSSNFWKKLGFLSFKKVSYCNQEADYMVLIK